MSDPVRKATVVGTAVSSFRSAAKLRDKVEQLASCHRVAGTASYACYSDAPPREDGDERHALLRAAPAGRLSGLRALVVEDEYLTACDLSRVLAREGSEVTLTGRSDDALRKLKGEHFDVVLLDRLIYGGTVDRLADELMERGCAFVFVSGYDPDDLDDRFRQIPYITKPVDDDELVQVIDLVCE